MKEKTHQLGSVMQSGAAAGMHTLDYDLAKLVSRGLIEKKQRSNTHRIKESWSSVYFKQQI